MAGDEIAEFAFVAFMFTMESGHHRAGAESAEAQRAGAERAEHGGLEAQSAEA